MSSSKMQGIPTPVDALQFGMYIAELDRPWTETPFMFQGFYLRTAQQLQGLRKFCRHVYVDPDRSECAAPRRAPSAPALASAPGFAIRGNASYSERVDVRTEMRSAHVIYAQS